MKKTYTPCGGCGAEHPDDRCIGCGHQFEAEEEKKYPIEYTPDIPQSRLLAEKFFDEELAKITDVARRHEVSQEKETWIGCFMAGYKAGVNVDDWISVTDQLPSESGRYWCYVEELTDLGFTHFQWNCYFDEKACKFSDSTLTKGENVTHWRLLPAPPKI